MYALQTMSLKILRHTFALPSRNLRMTIALSHIPSDYLRDSMSDGPTAHLMKIRAGSMRQCGMQYTYTATGSNRKEFNQQRSQIPFENKKCISININPTKQLFILASTSFAPIFCRGSKIVFYLVQI